MPSLDDFAGIANPAVSNLSSRKPVRKGGKELPWTPGSRALRSAWMTPTGPGHHLALGQMAMAHDAGATALGLQFGLLGEELRNLGLYDLSEQGAPRCIGSPERIVEGSWLNQLWSRYRPTRHIAPSVEK